MNLAAKIVYKIESALQNMDFSRDLFYAFVVILIAYLFVVFCREQTRSI